MSARSELGSLAHIQNNLDYRPPMIDTRPSPIGLASEAWGSAGGHSGAVDHQQRVAHALLSPTRNITPRYAARPTTQLPPTSPRPNLRRPHNVPSPRGTPSGLPGLHEIKQHFSSSNRPSLHTDFALHVAEKQQRQMYKSMGVQLARERGDMAVELNILRRTANTHSDEDFENLVHENYQLRENMVSILGKLGWMHAEYDKKASEVRVYLNKVTELEEAKQNVQEANARAEAQQSELRMRVKELQAEQAMLRNEQEEKYKKKITKLQDLIGKAVEVKHELKASKAAQRQLEAKLSDALLSTKAQKQTINRISSQNKELTARVSRLEGQHKDAQMQNRAHQAKIKVLLSKQTELEEGLTDATQEMQELELTAGKLTHDLKAMTSVRDRTAANLKATQNNFERTKTELTASLQSSQARVREGLESSRAAQKEWDSKRAELQGAQNMTTQRLLQAEAIAENLADSLQNSQAAATAFENDLALLKQQASEAERETFEKLSGLQKQRDDLVLDNDRLQTQVTKQTQWVQAMEITNHELQSSLQASKETAESRQQELQELSTQHAELTTERDHLQHELDTADDKHTSIIQAIRFAHAEALDHKEHELFTRSNENEALKEVVTGLENDIEQQVEVQAKQHEIRDREINRLHKNAEEAESTLKAKGQQIHALKQQQMTLQTSHAAALEGSQKTFKDSSKDMEFRVESLEEELLLLQMKLQKKEADVMTLQNGGSLTDAGIGAGGGAMSMKSLMAGAAGEEQGANDMSELDLTKLRLANAMQLQQKAITWLQQELHEKEQVKVKLEAALKEEEVLKTKLMALRRAS